MPQPESLTRGEEQIAFFYWVGRAIAAWSWVEIEIYALVAGCFEPGNDGIITKSIAVGFLSD